MVYPRAGGGTGLERGFDIGGRGSIPAQAGEPDAGGSAGRQHEVYPRAGGGNPSCLEGRLRVLRSIPAQAGEPQVPYHLATPHKVYPRAGGGTRLRPRPMARRSRVYPRAGGGTFFAMTMPCRASGLSPRRRGNPNVSGPIRCGFGSIPAQAGEPPRCPRSPPPAGVYPRAGGGTLGILSASIRHAGLSPRRRGNLVLAIQPHVRYGSIPAQAGEPRSANSPPPPDTVYPRAGGGNRASGASGDGGKAGLSPRRRGGTIVRVVRIDPPEGLSPRRRGEPGLRRRQRRCCRVYPRAGGGTSIGCTKPELVSGLSPRRRGNLALLPQILSLTGSIPAQAGEPKGDDRVRGDQGVYPRAGGGEPSEHRSILHRSGVYPRAGRGNLDHRRPCARLLGSIPAQAGEPAVRSRPERHHRVYPRAGGGTGNHRDTACRTSGLSPRRRGNPRVGVEHDLPIGSIPAQAGEPPPTTRMAIGIAVYPRAGGGTSGGVQFFGHYEGLSPRRRGNLHGLNQATINNGSIPRAGGGTTRSPLMPVFV